MDTDDRPAARAPGPTDADRAAEAHYEICVAGRIGSRWSSWFDGLTLTHEEDGTTVLRGPIVDQAALHGLLQQLRDLGVTLLSLTRTPPGEPTDRPRPTTTRHRTTTPGATP